MDISANPGRILLVDDEPAVLGVLERQLRSQPWELLTASSADEGLEQLTRRRRERLREADRAEMDPKELEEDFARAEEQLWLAVQPIVSARTSLVYGYEALLRSDARGMESPLVLFETAGRQGRKTELSRHVRSLAARLCPRLPADNHLLVNLNPEDLEDPELLEGAEPLAEYASRVVLKVTERDGIEDEERLQERIRTLRGLGYRVALDDLGAGYASLNSLAILTPDFVKFDMSLIREIDRSQTKRRVVEHMLDLCNDLGIRTIAEGVETEEEYEVVRDIGCNYLQGYLFGRPLRAFGGESSRAA